jgi:hypothetical protein
MQGVGNSQWTYPLPLPWEGPLQLEARAADAAGNFAKPIALNIISDQSAPLITVTGVSDGLRADSALRPIISIEDASEFTSVITLDDQPYVSGTIIGSSGDHLLSIVAEDVLGQRSSLEIRFSIDVRPVFIPALRFDFAALGLLLLLLFGIRRLIARREPS